MRPGKLTNEQLRESVLSCIKCKRKEVVLMPGIGEDCGGIDFGGTVCVLSTDPITAASKDIGRLATNISCNDVASSGAEPIGIMITVLAPTTTTIDEIEEVMRQVCAEAEILGLDIIGGHTEITDAVKRMIISSTVVGKVAYSKLIRSSGAGPGDSIILTKWAGLEGTGIILNEYPHLLGGAEGIVMASAQELFKDISVVKEGLIAADHGVSAMHDVTEGGVLGAVWETAQASSCGAVIEIDRIPVLPITEAVCDKLSLDPLRLISSGCMIMCCKDGERLVERLTNGNVKATIIGSMTEGSDVLSIKNGHKTLIQPPDSDEIYKITGEY